MKDNSYVEISLVHKTGAIKAKPTQTLKKQKYGLDSSDDDSDEFDDQYNKRAAARKTRPRSDPENTVGEDRNNKKFKPNKNAGSEKETGFEPQYFLDINHWFESRPNSVMDDEDDEESDKQNKQLGHIPRAFLEIRALKPEIMQVMGRVQDMERPYSCKFCVRKPFRSVFFLMKHVLQKHDGKEPTTKPYQCKKCCDEEFDDCRKWLRHCKEKLYRCIHPGCVKRFTQHYNMQGHFEEVHKVGEPKHICDICSYAFKKKCALKKHVDVVHSNIKPHMCKFCGHRFANSSSLQLHERTHTQEKPFKCDLCDKGFISKRYLQYHMLDHKGIKPYMCEICAYATKDANNLKLHMKTHSTEEPFQCDQCGKRFKVKKNMKLHKRVVHNEEKTHKCRICGKLFRYRATKYQHEKTHPEWSGLKKYICKVCGLDCQSAYKLKTHTRVHTKEKPFHCDYCDYSSSGQKSMDAHMRRHTGAQPYKGKKCDMRLMYYQQCTDHKQLCCSQVEGSADNIQSVSSVPGPTVTESYLSLLHE